MSWIKKLRNSWDLEAFSMKHNKGDRYFKAPNPTRKVVSIFIVSFFGLISIVPLASAVCCSCYSDSPVKTICLNFSTASCSNALSSVSNPKLSGMTCAGEVSTAQCRMVADGGVCNELAEAALYEPANGETQATAQSTNNTTDKFTPLLPSNNIDIPGLEYSSDITVEEGKITVPLLAQYVAALYRYVLAAALIAAAIMVTYGGFLYVVGATAKSVTHGKQVIIDALAGLMLVFSATTLLYFMNPEASVTKPLVVKYVKHDADYLNTLLGDPADYPPVDFSSIQQEASKAAGTAAGAAIVSGTGGSFLQAAGGSFPQAAGTTPASTISQPPEASPNAQWQVSTDGKKLWPSDCSGIQLVGKNNKPGSYTAIFAALSKPAGTKEQLAERVKAVVEASKTGAFYARGIEYNKPRNYYTDPPEVKTRKNGTTYKLIPGGYPVYGFDWWLMNEIYNVRKWRTDKMLGLEACGTDLPSSAGLNGSKFAAFFAKPANKTRLVPCMNAIIEVYNNTYLAVAKCFDIKTDQCSFAQNIKPSGVKIIEVKDVPKDDLIAGFKGGAYPPGTNVSSQGGGHQWVYVGGLGLGYEVLEWGGSGGDSYNNPNVVISPGFFGEETTTFKPGIRTSKSVASYLNTQSYKMYTIWVPEW